MRGQTAIPSYSCYHAGRWGLEGFSESVAKEVGDFGIRFSIVEPGGTRTDFLSGMRFTEETEPYRDTAVGAARRSQQSLDAAASVAFPD